MRDYNIDILTVNFNKDVRIGGLAARWAGSTKVFWRMGLDITGNGLMHRWLTPKLVDTVVVPSEALKQQVTRRSYLPGNIVQVIHNGAADRTFTRPDPEAAVQLRAKYSLPSDSVVAVTAGRFVEQKGHAYLVEAAVRIVKDAPNIRFLWLGDGHLEGILKNRKKILLHAE